MAIQSKVQICNLALLRLGTNPITSFTDGTAAANACSLVYDHCRESLLRRHLWNFATDNVELAADATSPAFKYTYRYPLPSDFIRVKEVYNQGSDFTIDGSSLYTDDPAPLKLSYIKDVTDSTKFDSMFVESLILMVIIKIGSRVQGDGFNPEMYMNELRSVLLDAKRVDAQDASPGQWDITTFTGSRNSSGSWLAQGKSFSEY